MKRLRISFWAVAALMTCASIISAPPAFGASDESEARTTEFPATASPDEICLTWNGDPRTTQAVQWRTAAAVNTGAAQYRAKTEPETAIREVPAAMTVLTDEGITNDPTVHHFTATMTGLEAGTTYAYRVGSADNGWSAWAEFNTAPAGSASFSFIYMGDAQAGLADWGLLLQKAQERFPETAFYAMAGDLVNRGSERDDWDRLLKAAEPVFSHVAVVPAIGNHEYGHSLLPALFTDHFALPENGPDKLPPEHAYAIEYGNTLLVVLDTNMPPQRQIPWLEQQLARPDFTWKLALFHIPLYSSKPSRDNAFLRKGYRSLFEKYDVDVVLQGHDHAYLRTKPLKEDKVAGPPPDGVYYALTVSGSKFYDNEPNELAAVQMTNTSTYQVIDIQTGDTDRLTYRAYDGTGAVRDEFEIEKPKR